MIRFVVSGVDESDVDLVSLVGVAELMTWCAAERRAAPLLAAMTEPLREQPIGEAFGWWSDFTVQLLALCGSNADVLQNVSARIHSGSWAGSAVPRLLRHRAAFEQLLGHPNPEVINWAAKEVAYLEAQIEREKKRDAEREFGIYR